MTEFYYNIIPSPKIYKMFVKFSPVRSFVSPVIQHTLHIIYSIISQTTYVEQSFSSTLGIFDVKNRENLSQHVLFRCKQSIKGHDGS